MPEPKFLSPLMDGLEFGACVQSEGSKSVYLMRDTKNGTVYLLRVFQIPESERQMDALIYSGAVSDRAEALRYYTDQIIELRRTLETIKGFADFTGVQVHTDYQIDQLPDEKGFAVYVLSPYLPTLAQHLTMNPMTMLEALNMGIDLCDALFGLHESGYMVQNISLENILITPKNQFVISNLSLANLDRLEFGTITDDQISLVSAPELHGLIPSFRHNSDLYALGLVLYYIFNGNHVPFVDENTTPAAALKRRIEGEELPAPMYADYELGEIILKACAFDPEARYQGPDEFKAALVQYMQRNPVSDTLIVPPIISEPDELLPEELEEEDVPLRFAAAEELDQDFVAYLSPSAEAAPVDEADVLLEEKLDALIGLPDEPETVETEQPVVRRSGKNGTLATILSICAIVACGIVLLVLFLRPKPIEVQFLNATDVSATEFTVTLQLKDETKIPISADGDPLILITCSDAYGNVLRKPYADPGVTFTDLTPGTQYAIGVEHADEKELTGRVSINATTNPAANLNAITLSDLTTNSVNITLSVSGYTPKQWTITCTASGLDPMTHTFAGNTIQITGLVSNTEYTCTFTDPDGSPIRGENTVTFVTEPKLTLESFEAVSSTANSVSLAWSYSGDRPATWALRCEGSDGSSMEKVVEGVKTTFEELKPNVSYTFTIGAKGMEATSKSVLEIANVSLQIKSFTAEAADATSIAVNWDVEGADETAEWNIALKIAGEEDEILWPATGNSLTIDGLIPQTNYVVELKSANGKAITGESLLYVRTPVAEPYKANGTTNLYTALYRLPDKEDWSISDLKGIRTTFEPGEGIVIAIESINGIRSSNDEIAVRFVIRDSEGLPVTTASHDVLWKDLWDGKILIRQAPNAPEETGKYTLELYFNGKLLTDKDFTVE